MKKGFKFTVSFIRNCGHYDSYEVDGLTTDNTKMARVQARKNDQACVTCA